jgi:hypothetical protein
VSSSRSASASHIFDNDAYDVFNDLVLSESFCPKSAPILDKWEIINEFWKEDHNALLRTFGSDGMGLDDSSLHGFGFLVEGFARLSRRLPKNTLRADEIGSKILDVIEGAGRKRYNRYRLSVSDLINVCLKGRRATVKGIIEVKSSVGGFNDKKWQLKKQEANLRQLKCSINRYRIVVHDPLEKILALPSGERSKLNTKKFFPEWLKVIEIEFTRDELLFIAKRMWPNMRGNRKFRQGGTIKEIVHSFQVFEEWAWRSGFRLDNVYKALPLNIPRRAVAIMTLALAKAPCLQEDMDWLSEVLDIIYWTAMQRHIDAPFKESEFHEYEKGWLAKFPRITTIGNGQSWSGLLSFSRHFREAVLERLALERRSDYLLSDAFYPLNLLKY